MFGVSRLYGALLKKFSPRVKVLSFRMVHVYLKAHTHTHTNMMFFCCFVCCISAGGDGGERRISNLKVVVVHS